MNITFLPARIKIEAIQVVEAVEAFMQQQEKRILFLLNVQKSREA